MAPDRPLERHGGEHRREPLHPRAARACAAALTRALVCALLAAWVVAQESQTPSPGAEIGRLTTRIHNRAATRADVDALIDLATRGRRSSRKSYALVKAFDQLQEWLKDDPSALEERFQHAQVAYHYAWRLTSAHRKSEPPKSNRRKHDPHEFDRMLSRCANIYAELLQLVGDPEASAREAERSLLFVGPWDPFATHLLYQLAVIAAERHQWDEALRHLSASMSLFESRTEGDEIIHNTLKPMLPALRAEVLMAMGLPDQAFASVEEAKELLEEALRSYPAGMLRGARTSIVSTLIDYYLTVGQQSAVLREGKEALAAEDLHVFRRWLPALIRERVGAALSEVTDDASPALLDAETWLLRAIEDPAARASTRLSALLTLGHVRLREKRLPDAHAALASANDVLAALPPSYDLHLPALQRAYLAALEVACDEASGKFSQRAEALAAAVSELLKLWRDHARRPGGLGFLANDAARFVLTQQMRVHLQREDPEAALDVILRARGSSTLVARLGGRPRTLGEIRERLLHPGIGALIYMPAGDRSYVFAVDRDEVTAKEIDGLKMHVRPLRDFVARITSSPHGHSRERLEVRRRTLERLSNELGEWLIPSKIAERMRSWTTTYIVGQDLLESVPFEALSVAGLGELGLKRAVAYLPSLSLGVTLVERPSQNPPPTLDLLMVAAPRHKTVPVPGDAPIEPLPWDSERAHLLTRAFPKCVLLAGAGATYEALGGPELKATRILHVMTHGIVDYRRERCRGFLLASANAPHRAVYAEDVERELAGPSLVILSACRTGRGNLRPGDPSSSDLGGAFLASSARCVVLPGTDIAYDATVEITARVHAELAKGQTIAEALRRARVHQAQSTTFGDPYYRSVQRAVGLAHESCWAGAASAPSAGQAPSGNAPLSETRHWLWLTALGLAAGGAWLWTRRPSKRR